MGDWHIGAGGRRPTRRVLIGRLGAVGAVLLAAGGVACGGGGPPGARRTQPVTLDAWSRLSWFKDLADAYAHGPGQDELVTVAPTIAASPLDFQNKLLAAAAAGTPPDVTTVELNISPLLNVQRVYDDISKEYGQLQSKDQLPPAMVRYGG